MGCGENCPGAAGGRDEEWMLPDPAGQPLQAVRAVRDDIEAHVGRLLAQLDIPTCA